MQDKTNYGKVGQHETIQCKPIQHNTRHYSTIQHKTHQDKTLQVNARQVKINTGNKQGNTRYNTI